MSSPHSTALGRRGTHCLKVHINRFTLTGHPGRRGGLTWTPTLLENRIDMQYDRQRQMHQGDWRRPRCEPQRHLTADRPGKWAGQRPCVRQLPRPYVQPWTMRYELWTMNYEIWTMNYEIWTMRYELWTMNYEIWTMNYEIWTMNHELWDMPWTL